MIAIFESAQILLTKFNEFPVISATKSASALQFVKVSKKSATPSDVKQFSSKCAANFLHILAIAYISYEPYMRYDHIYACQSVACVYTLTQQRKRILSTGHQFQCNNQVNVIVIECTILKARLPYFLCMLLPLGQQKYNRS